MAALFLPLFGFNVAAIKLDNRRFIKIVIGGRQYRALLDPGATPSLVGSDITKRFEDRTVDTSTRVRTATGNVTLALGNFPLTVEVASKSERITFRAIAELEQELTLGMDFCRLFDVDTCSSRGVWCAHKDK